MHAQLAGSVTDIGPVPIAQVQDGCSAVSPSRRTQSRICSGVCTAGPGDSSPALYGSMAGWVKIVRATRDRLDPFAPVLLGGQVVEPQRGLGRGIGRGDPDAAARVGVHRADVHLVAVPAGGRRAVVADRDRQEVEHQVRVGDVVVAAGESAALEVVGRARAAAQEQPAGADQRPVAPLERGRDRDRLLAAVLDVDLEVILQVLADAGQLVPSPARRPPASTAGLPMPDSCSS